MLSTADADLVRRDPAIVALGTLLDPDRLLSTLRRALPEADLQGITVRYVRYKPGTSCLIAFQILAAGALVDAYAVGYRTDERPKLEKARRPADSTGALAVGRLVLEDGALVVSIFPNDRHLASLARLENPATRGGLLRKLFPARPDLWEAEVRGLRYKPDRRYVAQLLVANNVQAVLKLYLPGEYEAAKVGAEAFVSRGRLRVARQLGCSDTHRVVAWQWLPGLSLEEIQDCSIDIPRAGALVGEALAEMHAQNPAGLARLPRAAEIATLEEVAVGLSFIAPRLQKFAERVVRRLATRLIGHRARYEPIHNDFYAAQALWDCDTVGVLDLDRSVRGDPARDIGNFLAHLERDVTFGAVSAERARAWHDTLLQGYERRARHRPRTPAKLYVAVGLLQLAAHPFRERVYDWLNRTEALLDRASAILDSLSAATNRGHIARVALGARGGPVRPTTVIDPFGVVDDARMPFLKQAIEVGEVKRQFAESLPRWFGHPQPFHLRAIRVARYKPGRRCLIEYEFDEQRFGAPPGSGRLLGKSRAKGLDDKTFHLMRLLWHAGFDDQSADRVSIPEPVGRVRPFEMFLQRKVPGTELTGLLAGPHGLSLARRVAEALYQLHKADVRPRRRHGMTDELRILHDRLLLVEQSCPKWKSRLRRVSESCRQLADSMIQQQPRTIHRDFYADHVLVDGDRFYLVDFDLCCLGDPALDVGNFLGHVTEQSLREFGNAEVMADREEALLQRYAELSGRLDSTAVYTYATLTLARHIYISTQISNRSVHTEALLDLCEHRCGAAKRRPLARRPRAARRGESIR